MRVTWRREILFDITPEFQWPKLKQLRPSFLTISSEDSAFLSVESSTHQRSQGPFHQLAATRPGEIMKKYLKRMLLGVGIAALTMGTARADDDVDELLEKNAPPAKPAAPAPR